MAFYTDITLGKYYASDSWIHALDPRTKLTSLMGLMICLLITLRPLMLIFFGIVAVISIRAAKLPLALVLRNLRPFAWLFAITVLVHIFWTRGEVVYQIPWIGLDISHEGLLLGFVYSMRLALLVVYAAILTLTTLPIEIADALESLFSPLERLRVPTHEMVMMLTLSLRFIPTLMEEAQRIKNAQISRGATFEGNILEKVKSVIPLILPLFVSAFRRADDLALAMDSRCYSGGKGRSRYKSLHFAGKDYVVLTGTFLLMLAIILIETG